ncbi:hypothetical protein CDD83_8399 [Cordyceps sp. RAO-2017]|nr:hypothetical protein CDD83_8399 [Cordyceps sp. RAO-2017]
MNAPSGTRLGLIPAFLRASLRRVHTGRRPRPSKGFQGPEKHGENIWVFAHRRTEQIIYSFNETLDGYHHLKQLPFHGKKTKPAKLRKDYWSPMAMIQFPAGQGAVGRSVFQKLRELKHLHEVAWGDEIKYKSPQECSQETEKKRSKGGDNDIAKSRPLRSKEERGQALNAQRKNAIADMAVVLSGKGPGNKMVVSLSEDLSEMELVDVQVSWSNDHDKRYAESWSRNVTHALFDQPAYSLAAAG